ncbi:MAG TPA: M56 family metallopeptidase [Acidisarcina sp.]
MQIPSSVVFDYAFNALWEVPLVVAAAAVLVRLLGGVRAEVAHRVWVGCLLLAVISPGLPLAGHSRAASTSVARELSAFNAAANVETLAGATAGGGAGDSGHVARVKAGRVFAWRPILLSGFCWLYVGSIVFAVTRLMIGLRRTGMLVRFASPATLTPELRATLDRCLRSFGMSEIAVVSSAQGAGPATVCWPRPLMILPAELQGAGASEMAAAFCHELAHMRRGDFLRNLGYEACGVLLFFHPAMHWAMRRLRETREMACDEMAAAAMDGSSEYTHSLLKLAQRMAPAAARPGLALGVFDDGSLERRVMNLIEKKMKQTVVRAIVSAAAGLGLLAGVVDLSARYGLQPVLAQSSEESSKPPAGWLLAGDKPANYRTGVDKGMMHDSMPSAFLVSRVKESGFGTLMQTISASRYAGKRVRLRGWVRSQDVADWAGLWMRVDRGEAMVGFDNMQHRPIKGTREWASYDVVLDVPADATGIAFGVLEAGPGEVWINDLKFEVVGPEVALTANAAAEEPVNLGFQK